MSIASKTASLVIQRGMEKTRLTKFVNKIKECQSDGDILQLEQRQEKMEESWQNFQKIQSVIEVSVDNIKPEITYRCEFEDTYFQAMADCARIIDKQVKENNIEKQSLQNMVPPLLMSDLSGEGSNLRVNAAPFKKLPPLEIPEFNGEYKNWSTFKDLFETLINSDEQMPDVHKFFYLKKALKSGAARAIQSYDMTAKNYHLAWKYLNDRYNNTKIIVQTHTKAIYDLDSIIKVSASQLRRFLDSLTGNMNTLEQLGYDPLNWGPMLLHIITTKLDVKTLEAWETEAPKTQVA
ncbi:uncharacterized protein LOC126895825 [Daktulosphaira vitifoliae]|uniref:uncharacterized protein LOC126895825 n=1 Tax=Daktulosphaira vitifoliae TaxID=58002 RepID=UPI0021A987BB|nr:uncharacterized protein LOC126895825 [Daktulosphaira vitifoliae]